MPKPQLYSLARMISQRQLEGGFLALDWDENTGNYVLRVSTRGTQQDLLSVVDKLRGEIDTMYYQVKQDILTEYARLLLFGADSTRVVIPNKTIRKIAPAK